MTRARQMRVKSRQKSVPQIRASFTKDARAWNARRYAMFTRGLYVGGSLIIWQLAGFSSRLAWGSWRRWRQWNGWKRPSAPVKTWNCGSIVEPDNGTIFVQVIISEKKSETFRKAFVKLKQTTKERGKVLVDRNFQTISFNIRSIKLVVVKNYKRLNNVFLLTDGSSAKAFMFG